MVARFLDFSPNMGDNHRFQADLGTYMLDFKIFQAKRENGVFSIFVFKNCNLASFFGPNRGYIAVFSSIWGIFSSFWTISWIFHHFVQICHFPDFRAFRAYFDDFRQFSSWYKGKEIFQHQAQICSVSAQKERAKPAYFEQMMRSFMSADICDQAQISARRAHISAYMHEY